jgi:hypothetical protein
VQIRDMSDVKVFRYGANAAAVEMFGHRTIQIASETSLIAYVNRVV